MKISIVIVTYNTRELIKKSLSSLFPTEDKPNNSDLGLKLDLELIFVDNNSEDGTAEYLEQLNKERADMKIILNDDNFGFARAVNEGIRMSEGTHILLLNSDAFITQNQIRELSQVLELHSVVGAVSPGLINPDSSIQPSFGHFPNIYNILLFFSRLDRILPWGMVVYPSKKRKNKNFFVQWSSAACLMIKREVINEIGLLDDNYFLGIEDIDLCYRVRKAGYRIIHCPRINVTHYHQYTSRKLKTKPIVLNSENEGLKYFYQKFYPQKIWSYAVFAALVDLKKFLQTIKTYVS